MNEMFPMTNDFLDIRLQFLLSSATWLEYSVAITAHSGIWVFKMVATSGKFDKQCMYYSLKHKRISGI